MIETYSLSEDDISYLLSLPEVTEAKEKVEMLSSNGHINFSIQIPHELKEKIGSQMGINLTGMETIPMRWIKGDTPAHSDVCIKAFDKTYLAYLTDSEGSLVVDGDAYAIAKGNAYVFSEGLMHETTGTGIQPRLLLGPMSEEGIYVGGGGTNISEPGGTTIYIQRDTSGNYQYSINNQASWNNFVFPVFITNTNTAAGYLNVEFVSDIIVNSVSAFFQCLSSFIQFGSTTLPVGGLRRKIDVNNTGGYSGFIRNGTSLSNGFGNVNIFNLIITDSSGSSIASGGGWLVQGYFGSGASGHSYIVNCSSTGSASSQSSGGVIGEYAYVNSQYVLYVYGCSNSGITSGDYAGGIVGSYAGANPPVGGGNGGRVYCQWCYSTGTINGLNAGGIYGAYGGGANGGNGEANASYCYSTGAIFGFGAGGIYGSYAGTSAISQSNVTNCYSRGDIVGPESGGLVGSYAANNGGIGKINIYNCYASGQVTGLNAGGVYGKNQNVTNTFVSFVYTPGGFWNDSSANAFLQGTPNYPTTAVGNTWVKSSNILNSPYELYPMGFSPYNLTNITIDSSGSFVFINLRQSYTMSVSAGSSTPASVLTNPLLSPFDYKILQISGGTPSSYGTFLISSATGSIVTSTSTAVGSYTFYIRNTGSYNTTLLTLNVTEAPTPPPTPISEICFPAGTPVQTDQGIIAIDKINTDVHTIRNQKIQGIVTTKLNNDYLVCFEKNAIETNVPCERTLMSGNHRVYFNKQMRKAKELLNNTNCIYKVKYNGETMYNVLMEKHETMLVNNMLCETLDPTNNMAKIFYSLKNITPEEQKMIVEKLNYETLIKTYENNKNKKKNRNKNKIGMGM